MNPEGIGAAVLRREDPRFLTGRGRFVTDLSLPGMLACHVVRSPHAHAVVRAIRIERAVARAGVVAVFTGADMEADGVGPMRCVWAIRAADGTPMAEPPRWALARGRVRHVGEAIAVVIAETAAIAADAAADVDVEYEPPAAAIGASEALDERA